MENKVEPVKHRTLCGYSFYPITYKGKKYVIDIIGELTNHFVYIYEYKEKKTFFRGYKGDKILSYDCTDFEYQTESGTVFTFSICSEDFRKNYPCILKNILEKMEEKLVEKEVEEKLRRENDAWDGVIR